ncbi:protein translocase subunit SecF [Candidatus Anaplasma sp. TIGMIC]|nr:protein translocase subunit SecF [Candidatus Anaplasma sp. TIGMIC]MDB1135507.1 protein translocase subunit SecF [Candidatus Anaplasma sp. TIGMIC]
MIHRLIPEGSSFDFVRWGKVAQALSILLTVGSIALICFKGLVLGTDFTGGIVVNFQFQDKGVDAERVKDSLSGIGLEGISVQSMGTSNSEYMVIFRGEGAAGGQASMHAVKSALNGLGEINYKRLDYVGAQVGMAQVREGLIAVGCALVSMFLYLCVRFRWQFAVGGVAALMHDVIVTMGMISATGLEFSLPVMAAILMIIGYSVNDSVVIYDRVRELMRNSEVKDVSSIVNLGINSTLTRTLLTSGTTLLAALPLILLCEGAVRDLGIIAFFGIVVGTYSSIFVSTIPFIGSIQRGLLK